MQVGGLATLTWRAIAGSDVAAWAELLAAAEDVDRGREHYSVDDLTEALADPSLDVAADTHRGAYWRHWLSGSRAFRPAVSLLLWDGDQIASYQLVFEFEADTAVTGVREAWTGQVGTRPPWRGRGLASTLLTQVLAACQAQGYQRAALSVDTGNSTGALGIYERAGFAVTERVTSYVRPLYGGADV